VFAAAVVPRANNELLRVAEGQITTECAFDEGEIQIAHPDIHGYAGVFDGCLGAIRGYVVEGLTRRAPFIVAIFEIMSYSTQIDFGAAGNGGGKLNTVAVIVNGPDPGDDLLEVIARLSYRLGQHTDVIGVESLGEFVPRLQKPLVIDTAWSQQVSVDVKIRILRDNGFNRGMVEGGDHFGRVPIVRDPVRSHPAIGPRLGHDPIHDLAQVGYFLWRPGDVPVSKRGAAAPHIHRYKRIARRSPSSMLGIQIH
jgi:hypothetical protein